MYKLPYGFGLHPKLVIFAPSFEHSSLSELSVQNVIYSSR